MFCNEARNSFQLPKPDQGNLKMEHNNLKNLSQQATVSPYFNLKKFVYLILCLCGII